MGGVNLGVAILCSSVLQPYLRAAAEQSSSKVTDLGQESFLVTGSGRAMRQHPIQTGGASSQQLMRRVEEIHPHAFQVGKSLLQDDLGLAMHDDNNRDADVDVFDKGTWSTSALEKYQLENQKHLIKENHQLEQIEGKLREEIIRETAKPHSSVAGLEHKKRHREGSTSSGSLSKHHRPDVIEGHVEATPEEQRTTDERAAEYFEHLAPGRDPDPITDVGVAAAGASLLQEFEIHDREGMANAQNQSQNQSHWPRKITGGSMKVGKEKAQAIPQEGSEEKEIRILQKEVEGLRNDKKIKEENTLQVEIKGIKEAKEIHTLEEEIQGLRKAVEEDLLMRKGTGKHKGHKVAKKHSKQKGRKHASHVQKGHHAGGHQKIRHSPHVNSKPLHHHHKHATKKQSTHLKKAGHVKHRSSMHKGHHHSHTPKHSSSLSSESRRSEKSETSESSVAESTDSNVDEEASATKGTSDDNSDQGTADDQGSDSDSAPSPPAESSDDGDASTDSTNEGTDAKHNDASNGGDNKEGEESESLSEASDDAHVWD